MPVQQPRARLRQQRILRAAAAVFARRGYGDAAVAEIAREAETSKGGLYFHFPGKEALLLALLDHTAGLLRGKVQTAMAAQADPVARAEAALQVLLRTFSRHRTLARVFVLEAAAAGPRFQARVDAIEQEFAALVRTELDLAVASGRLVPQDTDLAAQAWIGMLDGVIRHWVSSRDRNSLESRYEALHALLLRSVGAWPAPAGAGAATARKGISA